MNGFFYLVCIGNLEKRLMLAVAVELKRKYKMTVRISHMEYANKFYAREDLENYLKSIRLPDRAFLLMLTDRNISINDKGLLVYHVQEKDIRAATGQILEWLKAYLQGL
ncbi:hypothetical protein [Thermocrinis minervae]|uniref:Uncharacterized protein n=1 Tax=Thermocrinis minervae TaxID=381751 RepID=A0A1M6T4L0_9AQUI|nr:hypothetical protein [Thermocrinis minervae]SHK51854.1 hypothetical protein SAMN05444391_1298 [Thermocrinis minervae]